MEKAKVYYTKEITSESLIKIYEKLNVELKGKVGVKVSTGEIIIEDIKIKNGKVDLIESQFNQVIAGNTSAPEIKIILSEKNDDKKD